MNTKVLVAFAVLAAAGLGLAVVGGVVTQALAQSSPPEVSQCHTFASKHGIGMCAARCCITIPTQLR